MKKIRTIAVLLFVISLAGSSCHRAKHDRRDQDNFRGRMGMRMGHDQRGSRRMPVFHRFMGQEMNQGMGPGMMWDNNRGMGMMGGHGGMSGDSLGNGMGFMPMAPGRMMLESIPNVTEGQKKQIEDLMKKNFDEMKKIREEMSLKMKELMDSHQKEVLNILTEDQKKYFQSLHTKS